VGGLLALLNKALDSGLLDPEQGWGYRTGAGDGGCCSAESSTSLVDGGRGD
jgi:hypothetical protein